MLERFKVVIGPCLSALLIATIFALIALSFQYGRVRALDGQLAQTGRGHFVYALCGILSQRKYHDGRYICEVSQRQQLQDVGLWFDDRTLARVGKTAQQWLSDTAFLNSAIGEVFSLPPVPAGGMTGFGWGYDAGYMDYVDFTFHVFGRRIESLYFGFFLLMGLSTALFCLQFWRNYFVLITAVIFQAAFFYYLDLFKVVGLASLNNPRLLSLLAIMPFFHALFLTVYRARLSVRTALLFTPQALIVTAAADFRSLSYAAVIALAVCCLVLLVLDRRNRLPLRQAGWRYWPAYLLLICLGAGAGLQAATADPHIEQVGGMRYHTFWEPFFWDLHTSPDWNEYRARFNGASGDDIAKEAVQSYRERHNLLHVKSDFPGGNEASGIPSLVYEKYTRAAYIEFVRENPWFMVKLKYHNALTVIRFVMGAIKHEWSVVDWRLLILGFIGVVALVVQIGRKAESLGRLSICTGLLALTGIVVALPIWATAVDEPLMTDLTLLNVLTSFVLVFWALVCVGVIINETSLPFIRRLCAGKA